MKFRAFAVLAALTFLVSAPVWAQEAEQIEAIESQEAAPEAKVEASDAPPAATANDPTYAERVELAKKMHALRPSKDQVNQAIDATALRLPEAERETFKTRMRGVLNFRALEKISIDAMAEVYTAEELRAMVDYYSKPEAKSASDKLTKYNEIVGPELMKMIDQGMMRYRTGGN